MKYDAVLIIDFGSQVTQLIARRLRELNVYCEIHPFQNINNDLIQKLKFQAIILSGGPASVLDKSAPKPPQIIFDLGIPILGICYGQQIMMKMLGGEVVSGSRTAEFGKSFVSKINEKNYLLEGLFKDNNVEQVWMSHGDHVSRIPDDFKVYGKSDNAPFAIIGNISKHFYAVQFHPEVVHTPNGLTLIKNFLKIAGISFNWNMKAYREQAISNIRKVVGKKKVICALSGGVDSSVTAILIHKAIGDQLTCVYVDNGLMRNNESEEVIKLYTDHFKLNLIALNEQKLFLSNLNGISDPEQKRKIIGGLFIDVFQKQALKIGNVNFLAQGTLYPDVIESVSFSGGPSVTIKSHHNVGGLPDYLNLPIIEPLRELFKDEVRKLGKALGLSSELVDRHPFPGPGLGVRILGEIKPKYVKTLQLADDIFLEELTNANLYHKVSQAFAVFLPVKSVGVVGDARRYEYVIALRAVETIDFMTARAANLPHAFLEKVSTRIINEIPEVARVTYDISSKPPATIEWE